MLTQQNYANINITYEVTGNYNHSAVHHICGPEQMWLPHCMQVPLRCYCILHTDLTAQHIPLKEQQTVTYHICTSYKCVHQMPHMCHNQISGCVYLVEVCQYACHI